MRNLPETVCDEENFVPVVSLTVAVPFVPVMVVSSDCVCVVHSGSPSTVISLASSTQISAGRSGYCVAGVRICVRKLREAHSRPYHW